HPLKKINNIILSNQIIIAGWQNSLSLLMEQCRLLVNYYKFLLLHGLIISMQLFVRFKPNYPIKTPLIKFLIWMAHWLFCHYLKGISVLLFGVLFLTMHNI